jgi:hypothetical protein
VTDYNLPGKTGLTASAPAVSPALTSEVDAIAGLRERHMISRLRLNRVAGTVKLGRDVFFPGGPMVSLIWDANLRV